ncbi:unnamed protein product [Oncorhynchus mykiss]|uniref:Uncharacterized protein n=1 Tax=Oncorhynchus mykiss TaxID=8022 RepID=A0A060WMB0_ONCMY|nr:unnamed protein product [Oncorhynchus mykiss]
MEAELLRSKTEMMLLNNQLLEAVQKRLELALEVEDWKVLRERERQRQRESDEGGGEEGTERDGGREGGREMDEGRGERMSKEGREGGEARGEEG